MEFLLGLNRKSDRTSYRADILPHWQNIGISNILMDVPMRNQCYGHSLLPLNTNSRHLFYLETEPNVTFIYFCRLRQLPTFIFTVKRSRMLWSSISAVKDKLLTFILPSYGAEYRRIGSILVLADTGEKTSGIGSAVKSLIG